MADAGQVADDGVKRVVIQRLAANVIDFAEFGFLQGQNNTLSHIGNEGGEGDVFAAVYFGWTQRSRKSRA